MIHLRSTEIVHRCHWLQDGPGWWPVGDGDPQSPSPSPHFVWQMVRNEAAAKVEEVYSLNYLRLEILLKEGSTLHSI